VANPGDFVFGGGGFEDGVGGGAGGALEVIELDDGNAGAGRGAKRGSVEDLGRGLGSGCEVGKRGKSEYGGEEEDGADGEAAHISWTVHSG
jgi:hypothetical protein